MGIKMIKLLKRAIVASGHESHQDIRLKRFPRQVIVNFGNTRLRKKGLVINNPHAVSFCLHKDSVIELLEKSGVPVYQWGRLFEGLPYPIVLKSLSHRKQWPHLEKVNGPDELNNIFRSRRWEIFYWTEYTPCDREFRVHVSRYKLSPVFACEKVARREATWKRNLGSCTFVKKFDKPVGWNRIVSVCRKALRTVGLDIGGVDVGYNSVSGKVYVIEVNSAPGMRGNTRRAYEKELNKIALIKQFEI